MKWIGSPDSYKARVWRQELAKTDWDAVLRQLEAEAAAVKASDRRPGSKAQALGALRAQYRGVLSNKRLLSQHKGKS